MAFACIHIPDFLLQAVARGEPVFPCPLTGDALRGPRSDRGGQAGHPSTALPSRLRAGRASGGQVRHGGQALALLDGSPPLCRVVAANEAAMRAGIELGMAKAQAEQFRGVEIRRRSPEQERNAHAGLLDLAGSFSPHVEDTAAESILLDLAGLEPLFGSAEKIARGLAQGALDVCRLDAHVAVASNPDTALHAARGLPGPTVIPEGQEAAQLGPLPIGVLGASAEALETFDRWGVRTCAALAALPVLDLSERLGAEGVRLHQWARGAGRRSLTLAEPALAFEEALELDYEVAELEPLAFLLSRLLEALCARLAARSLAASALHLRLKIAGLGEQTSTNETGGIPRSARNDESGWFVKLLRVPLPLRNAKLLLNLLRLQLQSDPPGAPVCGIFLAAEPARPRMTQGGFFLPSGPDPEMLELTLARLAHLVGPSRVGSPQLVDTHRPDAFRMRRFVAGDQAPGRSSEVVRKRKKPQVAQKTGRPEPRFRGSGGPHRGPETGLQNNTEGARTGFRMFRPAPTARVEMRAGRPACVFFHGLRGEVLAASGPWRTSGDWWTKDSWQQDEWDLEIRFAASARGPATLRLRSGQAAGRPQRGLYRFAYDDLRDIWLVRGAFD